MELARPDMERVVVLGRVVSAQPHIRLFDSPNIFPFCLSHISAEHVASLWPRQNILRHGLDDDLVMLHEKGGVK